MNTGKYYMVRTDPSYIEHQRAAIGWNEIDLSVPCVSDSDRAALADKLCKAYYSNVSKQFAGKQRGQITRFLNIQKGDVIISPRGGIFYLGIATGVRYYEKDADMKNQIGVEYICDHEKPFPFFKHNLNTAFSTRLSVPGFTILELDLKTDMQNAIDELLQSRANHSLSDQLLATQVACQQELVEQVRTNLTDYNKTSLAPHGRGLEELVKALLDADGYITQRLSTQNGHGEADADLLAVKPSSISDKFSTALFVQVKHHWGITDSKGIKQLIEKKKEVDDSGKINCDGTIIIRDNLRYVLVSTGTFRESDIANAENDGIILIDGAELAEMIVLKADEINDFMRQLGFYKRYQS